MITIAAFKWVPDFARGFVRDLRLRWALEEAGIPYEVELIDSEMQKSETYRQWQPFGQVPAYRDEEVELFESGAIVLHIAATSKALAPADHPGQAQVAAWVFAALNSVEPRAQNYIHLRNAVSEDLQKAITAKLHDRLNALSDRLGDEDYLEGRFTAADIVMTTVLRELAAEEALSGFPRLQAYVDRNEGRVAFQKALSDQLADFDR
ncbi:glutathione S-transferase family protein [Pararhizobium sp. IMCC21322]|uniref:glutathione S-transferase family protein n=1 Tax=Pararhizobium sp. IMCC21322 TaxID=3067903 RepID=UPI002741EB29|nr:glutathione S-transferase family protein [Pararhizobium sp. IMCC21322]